MLAKCFTFPHPSNVFEKGAKTTLMAVYPLFMTSCARGAINGSTENVS
jgi:hypothetical protein